MRLAPAPEHHQRHGTAKAVAGIAATTGLLIPVHLVAMLLAPKGLPYVPKIIHKWFVASLGIKVRLHGKRARRKGVLYVANHLSWTDIPVLGSRLTGYFVAKSEVEGMALVGWLADLQRTIYVERERRHRSDSQSDAIAERLADGGNVILFPEGTTTANGYDVLPFKSSLFSAVEGMADVLVQPVSIAYTRINGLPVTHQQIHDVAWIGDAEIGEHAHDFTRLGQVRAEILLHQAVSPADFANRKALALHCERTVADGYAKLMRA
jgi:lyso-ornithine lipid O-acyltransferase